MTYSGSVVLEKIFKSLHFCDYLLFEEELALYLKQFRIHFTQGWFIPSLIEIGLLFWRRFLKMFSVFLLFCYHLPLGKGVHLHLNDLESPPPKNDLCIWSKFWRRSWKSKFTDGQTDGQQAIRKAHLSFQLRWAKKPLLLCGTMLCCPV
jgi:hypothetical protein